MPWRNCYYCLVCPLFNFHNWPRKIKHWALPEVNWTQLLLFFVTPTENSQHCTKKTKLSKIWNTWLYRRVLKRYHKSAWFYSKRLSESGQKWRSSIISYIGNCSLGFVALSSLIRLMLSVEAKMDRWLPLFSWFLVSQSLWRVQYLVKYQMFDGSNISLKMEIY